MTTITAIKTAVVAKISTIPNTVTPPTIIGPTSAEPSSAVKYVQGPYIAAWAAQ